jgi:hypothetical protein
LEFRPQRPRGWRRLLYFTVYRVVRPRSPLSRRERAFSAPSRRHAPGRPGQNLRGTGNSRRRGQPRLLGGEPAPIPSWTGREGGAEPKRHPPRRRTPAPRAPPAAAGGSRLCAVPRTSHRRADRGGWGEIRRRFLRGREERVAQSPGSACIRGPSWGSLPACASHTCGVVRHGSPRTAPTVAPHPLREPPHPSGAGRTRRRTAAIRQAN